MRGGETGAVVGSRDVRADIGIALGRRATFAPGNAEPPLPPLSLPVSRLLSFFSSLARSLALSLRFLRFLPLFVIFFFFSFFSLFLPLSMFLLFSRPPFQEILKYSKRRFRDHACVDDFSVVSISWKFWKQVFHFRFHLVLLSRVFLKKGWLLNLRIDEIFVYLEEKFLIIYII